MCLDNVHLFAVKAVVGIQWGKEYKWSDCLKKAWNNSPRQIQDWRERNPTM